MNSPRINILMTGFSGFVGKNLRVFINENEFQTTFLNLRASSAIKIKDQDVVIHLAGKAHDLKNVFQPEEYYKVNYELTKKLYDVFLESEAKKFIFISSVKAVADDVIGNLTEDTIPNPQTHYGKSKLMAEQYIQSHPLPNGKSWYILRPCMIHGPGNKGNLNLLYKFVSTGLPYPLAAFENKRSFLSVDNLCFIIMELIERDDIPAGIFNISDDEALSTNEVVSILSEALDRSPRLFKLPKSFIDFVAKVGDKLCLPLNSERLGKLTENYVVSNKKIKQVLKKELPLSAREGILKTARSFKNA